MSAYFELQTPEVVEKKVQQLFASKVWPDVRTVLNEFVDIFPMGKARVHLALLKLSDGDLVKLRHFVKLANEDSRDVVAHAEYSSQMRNQKRKSPKSIEGILLEDCQQYLDWLNDTARRTSR